MMEDLKHKVEAVLFAVGKKMQIEDIRKICKVRNVEKIQEALIELQGDYSNREGSVKLVNDEDTWKLAVSEQFIPVIQNLGVDTELTKSVMETLAIIAWKYPIMQNEVIHIRTNKAYDHLTDLEERGFISRTKHGRTRTIRLTDKFFQYFDLPNDKAAKNAFKDIIPVNIQNKVDNAEVEIIEGERLTAELKAKHKEQRDILKKEKEDQEKMEAGLEIEDDEGKKHELEEYQNNETKPADEGIEIDDEVSGQKDKLNTYGDGVPVVEPEKEELGDLQVYQETEEEQKEEEIKEETTEKKKGLDVDDKAVEKEIQRILHPEKEGQEEDKKEEPAEEEDESGEDKGEQTEEKLKDPFAPKEKKEEESDPFASKEDESKKEEADPFARQEPEKKEDSEDKEEESNDEVTEAPLIDEGGEIPDHAKVNNE